MKIKTMLLACMFAFTSVLYAGVAQSTDVEVDLENRFALGVTTTARASADDNQLIGCGTRTSDDGLGNTFRFGFCQATDAAGVNQVCFTQSPELLDEMRASSDFTFVTFNWNDNDECTRVGFSTQSFYLPASAGPVVADAGNGNGDSDGDDDDDDDDDDSDDDD